MNLLLLTPAPEGSLAGNRATAERWGRLLAASGHQVVIATDYEPTQAAEADLLIALHAWRSRESVSRWRLEQGKKPLLVVLTGTDLYRYQFSHPEQTLAAMEQADQLIALHRLAGRDVPHRLQKRVSVVLQSAEPPLDSPPKPSDTFDLCVIGHLRDEKDPLRAALAARHLPLASGVRVVQAGRAHTDTWQQAAQREMADNPRYHWLGEIDRQQTRALMAASRAMVISSVMEGGANVVSEACRAGLPILASDIPGNRGLLGDAYPGLFHVRDDEHLARLMARAENDADWLSGLAEISRGLADDFTPEREQAALAQAIEQALSHAG